MGTLTKKTKKSDLPNDAATSSPEFDDFVADYAGNGKYIPYGNVTVKTKAITKGDTLETETVIDVFGGIALSTVETNPQQIFIDLAKRVCREHPDIDIDPDMLGGMPHIKGVRLSVSNVLEKLYLYGNIEKIKEIYGDNITEHQIKEAIAYAQDFLESACVPS